MDEEKIKIGDIVTVDFGTINASNTFIVELKNEVHVFLKHPLYPEILIRRNYNAINTIGPILKDSTERSLDFSRNHKQYLDYNTIADLDALCLYFVVTRKLTPKQKKILSNICGGLATIHFNSDIRIAMNFIIKNEALLDDFNLMWFNNFSGLFKGNQNITSKKQRASIFNMAGFILGELENPICLK